METNERIRKLTERYKDKSLTRAERAEVMEELAHERYRLDPRKPISFKKQTAIDAVILLIDAISFSLMGIADVLGNDFKYGTPFAWVIFPLFMLVFTATIVWASYQKTKYKLEPADELSRKNSMQASNCAFVGMSVLLLTAVFVYFRILDIDELIIRREYAVNFVVSYILLTVFASKVGFLVLEGREEPEEE